MCYCDQMFGRGSDFIRIFLKLRLQLWLKKYLALWLQLRREERWGIKAVFLRVWEFNWRLLWQQAWRGHDKPTADLLTLNTEFWLGLRRRIMNHLTALCLATQIWPHKSQASWKNQRLTFDLYPCVGSAKEEKNTKKKCEWCKKTRDFQGTCRELCFFPIIF